MNNAQPQIVINNTRPAYRILNVNGFFGTDDHLYKEGDIIYWDDEPNEEMEPLNEPALDRMETYLTKLDELAKDVAIKTGKPYVGRPKNIDGGLAMATAVQRSEMNIMGRKEEATNIARVTPGETPETGSINPKAAKKPVGRPRKEPILSLSAIANA